MGLACTSRTVGKDSRVKPIEHALDEKLCGQVEYFQCIDILVESVVKGKMFFARPVLSQFISGMFFREILGVLQHYYFLVENLNQVELTFTYFP